MLGHLLKHGVFFKQKQLKINNQKVNSNGNKT